MPGFRSRVITAYNVLTNGRDDKLSPRDTVPSHNEVVYRKAWVDNAAAVLAPIQTRVAMDAANIPIRHVRIDEFDRYLNTIDSELNDRLKIDANIDQTGKAFIQDAVQTMLSSGSCAAVPINVSYNPYDKTSYDILDMRVGPIVDWFNRSVRVDIYDEEIGERRQQIFPKVYAAVAYNPLYAIMNAPNSTLRRLIDKLALLDIADSKLNSPKLDLILQLPYTLKSESRLAEAKRRIEVLTEQLLDSRYGIAYVDATEKIHQLNRPVLNNLMDEVNVLSASLYNQLGLTQSVFDGTADQQTIIAYLNRSVLPILNALIDSMIRSFLTRTARKQGQSIMAFPEIFKMAPLSDIADAADKFTRNEILTGNELRQLLGVQPSSDPKADELRNKNIAQPAENQSNPPIKNKNTKEVANAEK